MTEKQLCDLMDLYEEGLGLLRYFPNDGKHPQTYFVKDSPEMIPIRSEWEEKIVAILEKKTSDVWIFLEAFPAYRVELDNDEHHKGRMKVLHGIILRKWKEFEERESSNDE